MIRYEPGTFAAIIDLVVDHQPGTRLRSASQPNKRLNTMPNRRKVNIGGVMRDAEIIEFEVDKENFSTYILHDGTSLKIKVVLTEVFRVEGMFQPNGDPFYGVAAAQIVSVNAPDSLRKQG
jgi:hypothetical protein